MNAFLRKSELIIGAVLMLFLVIVATFLFPLYGQSRAEAPFLSASFRFGALLALALALYHVLGWNKKIKNVLYWTAISMFLLFQVVFVIFISYSLITDTAYVYTQAERLASGNRNWLYYFTIYPNNVNITILWAAIYKVFNFVGIHNHLAVYPVFQLIFMDLAIFALAHAANKFRPNLGKWVLLLSLGYIPLLMYIFFPYNDLLSVALEMIALAALMMYLRVDRKKQQWLYGIAMVVALLVAVIIRSNLVVVLLALAIAVALTKRARWFEKLSLLVIALVVFAGLYGITQVGQYRTNYVPDAQLVTPNMRYVNMSWNPKLSGEFNVGDAWMYNELPTNERSAKLEKIFGKRLEKMGPLGIVDHIVRKTAFMFSIGFPYQDFSTLQWSDSIKTPQWKINELRNWVTNLFQPAYILILILAFGAIVAALVKYKTQDEGLRTLIVFASLAVLGVFFFQVGLWEVRDRYAVPTFPFFILLAALGISMLGKQTRNRQQLNTKVGVKFAQVAAVLLSAGLLAVSYVTNHHEMVRVAKQVGVVELSSYGQYAERADALYWLEPNQTYKTTLILDQKAQQITLHFGASDPKNIKKMDIRLVNKQSGKTYKLVAKPALSVLNRNLRAGKYQLIVKTKNINPMPTQLFANLQTDKLSESKVTLNGKAQKDVAMWYSFESVHKTGSLSERALVMLYEIFGVILLLNVVNYLINVFRIKRTN